MSTHKAKMVRICQLHAEVTSVQQTLFFIKLIIQLTKNYLHRKPEQKNKILKGSTYPVNKRTSVFYTLVSFEIKGQQTAVLQGTSNTTGPPNSATSNNSLILTHTKKKWFK
jgi:hypothetical protein